MKKCICWLVLFLCLLFGQPALAVNWLFVGNGQRGDYYIDTDSIRQDGDVKYLWTVAMDKNDGTAWLRLECYARNRNWGVVHYRQIGRNGEILHEFTAQSAGNMRVESKPAGAD